MEITVMLSHGASPKIHYQLIRFQLFLRKIDGLRNKQGGKGKLKILHLDFAMPESSRSFLFDV